MRKTCLDTVYEIAKRDDRVFFIGSDLGFGVLKEFKAEIPDRFLMEGVSEANVVGMAAGLGLEGKIVYINTIATFFSRRAYEQIALDLALHRVKVRVIALGGGLVYAPLGPTHLAIEDMAIMRAIPGMAVVAPCDAEEMRRMVLSTVDYPGPIYIRVAKGGDPVVSDPAKGFELGKAIVVREGADALFITTGVTLKTAMDAADILKKAGIEASILHVHTIKPLDEAKVRQFISKSPIVVTVEEHTIVGGLGSAVAELMAESSFDQPKKFKRVGIPDVFPDEYGSQASLMEKYAITAKNLVSVVNALR